MNLVTRGLGGGLVTRGLAWPSDGVAPVTVIGDHCPVIAESLELTPQIADSADAELRPSLTDSKELVPEIAEIKDSC